MAERETIRVQLNYPIDRVSEPVLYRLVSEFGLVPNILRASIDVRTGGTIFLELSGARDALDSGLHWLADRSITVSAIGIDGKEWAL